MPHGGEEQVVLVLEIMVHEAGRHAGAPGDAGHGGMAEPVLVNDRDGRLHQLPASDRSHAELWHPSSSLVEV